MKLLSYTEREMEENFDAVKVTILRSLVADGLLDLDVADKWSKSHTVLLRPKSIFRTLSKLWSDAKDETSEHRYHMIVVDQGDV